MRTSKIVSKEKDVSLVNSITKIAVNCRKISRDDDLKLIIPRLIYTINKFNCIQQDDHLFKFSSQDIPVDELVVPQEFSFLLIPLSIRIDPLDLKTKDVKVIPEYKITSINEEDKSDESKEKSDKFEGYANYLEYKDDIHGFRRHFKLNGSDNLIKVMDVRKNVSLFDVLDSCCAVEDLENLHNNKVHYFRDAFWPTLIQKSSIEGLLEDNYFNDDFGNLMKDYLINLSFG